MIFTIQVQAFRKSQGKAILVAPQLSCEQPQIRDTCLSPADLMLLPKSAIEGSIELGSLVRSMRRAYVNYTDIEIDRNVICRRLGYSPDVEPSPRISAIIDRYAEKAMHLISPSYSYVLKDIITVSHSSATIEDSIVFHSQVISDLLEKSSKVAVFIATIGGDLEATANRLADNAKIVQSYVLDAIGSCLAESLASYVEARIANQVSGIGLSISRRFSPGYCDWDISQQEMVFRILSQEIPDVSLSKGCFMTPQKSISGIIGIAPPENYIADYNPCKACNKHRCVGRR